MKVHNILDNLFGSKSKVKILRLMFKYPDREFTEREIANEINVSPNTVNLSLRELREENLLSYRKVGRAHAYQVNRESVLFSYMTQVFEGERMIWVYMIQRLEKSTKTFISCVLFGSFAKKSEEYGSDIDLLVVVEDKLSVKEKLEALENEIMVRFGIHVSIIVFTPFEIKKKWNAPFMTGVKEEGILISGKPLEEIYGEED